MNQLGTDPATTHSIAAYTVSIPILVNESAGLVSNEHLRGAWWDGSQFLFW